MGNLRGTFLYEDECLARFSYLHQCTFKPLFIQITQMTRQGDNISFSKNTQKPKTSLRNICFNFLSKKKINATILQKPLSIQRSVGFNEVYSEIPFKVKTRIICRGVFRAQCSSNLGAFQQKKLMTFSLQFLNS